MKNSATVSTTLPSWDLYCVVEVWELRLGYKIVKATGMLGLSASAYALRKLLLLFNGCCLLGPSFDAR